MASGGRGHTLRIWADLATVGLFVVILIGFLDTLTGSALGCGRMWPLCNGGVLPGATLQSQVEYAHRAITGLVGLLVLVVTVWAWVQYRRVLEVWVLGAVGLGFVGVQSVVGAEAVLHPESAPVLATHFGFALLAFAGTALMTSVIHQLVREPRAETGWRRRALKLPRAVSIVIWVALVYAMGIAYLGTLVAHTGAGLACVGWPLCNGQVWPGLAGPTGLVFLHRLAALGMGALVILIVVQARRVRDRRPDVYRGAHLALGLVVLQIASGAYVVLSHITTTADIIHVSLMTLIFAGLAYLALQTLPLSTERAAWAEESRAPQ